MQVCFDVDFKSIRAVIYVIFCHYKFVCPSLALIQCSILSLWWLPLPAPCLVLAERIKLLHILSPISILVIGWCSCIQLSIWLFEACVCNGHVLASQKSTSWSPASFLTPSTNCMMTFDFVWFLILPSSHLSLSACLSWVHDQFLLGYLSKSFHFHLL